MFLNNLAGDSFSSTKWFFMENCKPDYNITTAQS